MARLHLTMVATIFLIGCHAQDQEKNGQESVRSNTATSQADRTVVKIEQYSDILKCAKTDDDKWRATCELFSPIYPDDESVAKAVRGIVCQDGFLGGDISLLWLTHFKSIVGHLELSEQCLWHLADNLDAHGRLITDDTRVINGETVRTYRTNEVSEGVLAIRWIEVLVGRKFSSREDCINWLTSRKGTLHWDRKAMTFK